VVADADVIDAGVLAPLADVVIVERDRTAGYAEALTPALEAVGRTRGEVALLGRVLVSDADLAAPIALAAELELWAQADALDGFVLVAAPGASTPLEAHLGLVGLARQLAPRAGETLRAALGLLPVAERLS
jgi:hypothetical protein